METVRIETKKIPILTQHAAAGMTAYLILKGKAAKVKSFTGLTMDELAEETGLSRPTLQRVLRDLVQDGLVKRVFQVRSEPMAAGESVIYEMESFETLEQAREFSSKNSGYLAPTKFLAT